MDLHPCRAALSRSLIALAMVYARVEQPTGAAVRTLRLRHISSSGFSSEIDVVLDGERMIFDGPSSSRAVDFRGQFETRSWRRYVLGQVSFAELLRGELSFDRPLPEALQGALERLADAPVMRAAFGRAVVRAQELGLPVVEHALREGVISPGDLADLDDRIWDPGSGTSVDWIVVNSLAGLAMEREMADAAAAESP